MVTRDGIFAASQFLRHRDIAITAAHYANKKTRTVIDMGAVLDERPKTEAVMEQLVKMSEGLETVSEQLTSAQAAIGLVVEALSKGFGRKLQKAFDLLQRDQWAQDIQKLWDCALDLANELQRPPTKGQLRRRYNPSGTEKDFTPLLEHADLLWLKKGPLKIPTSREIKSKGKENAGALRHHRRHEEDFLACSERHTNQTRGRGAMALLR